MSEEINVNEAAQATTSDTSEASAPVSLVDLLPADLKEDPSLKDFKDLGALAKSYVHLKHRLGASVTIPAVDASEDEKRLFRDKVKDFPGLMSEPKTDEEVEVFLQKLGKPKDATEYKYELPSEDAISKEAMQEINAKAFKLGLTQKQAQAVMNEEIEKITKSKAGKEEALKNTNTVLKEKWGVAFDERMAAAKAGSDIMSKLYPDHFNSILASDAAMNPAFVDLMATIGQDAKEKSLGGIVKHSKFHMTPEYAKDQISALKKDPEFLNKYLNGHHPEHREAVDNMTRLFKIASGTQE